MRNLLLLFLGILSFTSIQAQKSMSRNFSMAWDNDMYFLHDRYYTNGLLLKYEYLKPTKKKILQTVKTTFELKHDMYTPRFFSSNKGYNADRPYSGALYLTAKKSLIYSNYSLEFLGTIGFIGPGTLADKIQIEWHYLTNSYIPRGWFTQMRNDLIIGGGLKYTHEIIVNEYLKMYPKAEVNMNTYQAKAGGGLSMKIGKYAPSLMELDIHSKDQGLKTFLCLYTGAHYRIFDATLQGGLFADNMITIDEELIVPWIITSRIDYNLLIGRSLITFSATFQNKELKYTVGHKYGTLKFTYNL